MEEYLSSNTDSQYYNKVSSWYNVIEKSVEDAKQLMS